MVELHSRRAFLKSVPLVAVAATAPAMAMASHAVDPQKRIDAAMREIEAAMTEMYPGWRVQCRNDVLRPQRYVSRTQYVELEPNKHAIVIYAGKEEYGPEEVRWFTVDGLPLRADDVGQREG